MRGAAFPGQPMPQFSLPRANGEGEVRIGGTGRWQVVVVYRGKHCPLCKKHLAEIESLLQQFEQVGAEVVAISADPREKAVPDVAEMKLTFPIGYDLSLQAMQQLGLYISTPRNEQETDRPFAEPGLFVVNPAGDIQLVNKSNAPFVRPDMAGVAKGIAIIQERNYPVRGTMA